jgi:hypothetical protein
MLSTPPKRRRRKEEDMGVLPCPPALFCLSCELAKEMKTDIFTKQFDEFIKYIERTGKYAGFKKSTGVGTNLTPAVLDTVSKLNAAGYTNPLEPGKLLPNNFNLGESPNFQKVMSPIMNNIDDTRQDMIKSGKDETTSTQLANIRTACKSSHSRYLSLFFFLEEIIVVTVTVTDFEYCSDRCLGRPTERKCKIHACCIRSV